MKDHLPPTFWPGPTRLFPKPHGKKAVPPPPRIWLTPRSFCLPVTARVSAAPRYRPPSLRSLGWCQDPFIRSVRWQTALPPLQAPSAQASRRRTRGGGTVGRNPLDGGVESHEGLVEATAGLAELERQASIGEHWCRPRRLEPCVRHRRFGRHHRRNDEPPDRQGYGLRGDPQAQPLMGRACETCWSTGPTGRRRRPQTNGAWRAAFPRSKSGFQAPGSAEEAEARGPRLLWPVRRCSRLPHRVLPAQAQVTDTTKLSRPPVIEQACWENGSLTPATVPTKPRSVHLQANVASIFGQVP